MTETTEDDNIRNAVNKAKKEARAEFRKMLDELGFVSCVGMDEQFIEGSNWCNHLWRNKIKKLKEKIG